MKVLIATLIFISLNAQAKISGFNSMINDIQKAQTESHSEYLRNIGESEPNDKPIKVVLEEKQQPEQVNTKKNLLAFDKEKRFNKKPVKKIQERLAQELKDIE